MNEKPTNPKDAIAINKAPLHLWPEIATVFGSLALAEGAMKYGRSNWRAAGVRASVYVDACRRHLARWFEGEDNAPDSGLPHLAHALACLAILVDAGTQGKLTDDRQYTEATGDPLHYHLVEAEEKMMQMRERLQDKNPKHWTRQDKLK